MAATLAVVADDEWEWVLWPLLGLAIGSFIFAAVMFVLGFKQRRRARWEPLRQLIREGEVLRVGLSIHNHGYPVGPEGRQKMAQWSVLAKEVINALATGVPFGAMEDLQSIPSGEGHARQYLDERLDELRGALPKD